jgi:hypothetical protein
MSKPYEFHCRLTEAQRIWLETVCAAKRVTKTEWFELHLSDDFLGLYEEQEHDLQRVHSPVEPHAGA